MIESHDVLVVLHSLSVWLLNVLRDGDQALSCVTAVHRRLSLKLSLGARLT